MTGPLRSGGWRPPRTVDWPPPPPRRLPEATRSGESAAAGVVFVEAETLAAGPFGGVPVGGRDVCGVVWCLAAGDQTFQAALGPSQR